MIKMHDCYTLPAPNHRYSKQKHESRKCNCCPYGYHIDLDFVRYCEKVANSQLLGNPRTSTMRSRPTRKKRESIESLLGISVPVKTPTNGEIKEKREETFFNDELNKAVLDFEITLKNSNSNESVSDPRKIEEDTTRCSIKRSTVLRQEVLEPIMCSACKSNGLGNENAVILQDIRKQMAASLKRMKELEDEVKTIPQLKNQLKKLCWENKHLVKLLESKEQNVDHNGKQHLKGNGNKLATVNTRSIGVGNNVLRRNVAISTHEQLISIGTDPIIITPKMVHVQTNTDIERKFNQINTISDGVNHNFLDSPFLSAAAVRKRESTKNIGIQVNTSLLSSKKSIGVQIKPLCSNAFVHTELRLADSFTQTSRTQKKDVGVEVNVEKDFISKCDIGVNTNDSLKMSKYSDTIDLLKTADVSVNTNKKKRVDASVETCERLFRSQDKIEFSQELKKSKNEKEEKRKSFLVLNKITPMEQLSDSQLGRKQTETRTGCAQTNMPAERFIRRCIYTDSPPSKDNEKEGSREEVQEKIFSSIPTVQKRFVKKEPTKEMKGAMKVLNDFLQKSTIRGEMPYNMKNAINIIQQEWFKVSSVANANPLDVEDYLDCFEELSVTLLEYIVNMTDVSGNTAMHYAVSNGNFDVVSILLDSKVCNINKLNAAGYTCIMLVALTRAKTETDRQVVKRLFQMADVNIRAKQHGQTALMLAVSHGRIDTVQLLLESGADINIQDEDGNTALMCAAEHGYIDIVKILLAQPDCDLSIMDLDGNTALAIAMEAGNRDIGVLLYAQEHFSRTNSPFGSLKVRRAKSATPTLRTRSPTSTNCSLEHSL